MHLLGLFDKLLAEVGVCHIDEGFGLLPGGQTLEVDAAVFSAEVMQIGAGIGDDAAVFQRGTDAALKLTGLLIKEGRGQADEALATLGKVCAQHEVQLAACTGNVLDAGALRIHLVLSHSMVFLLLFPFKTPSFLSFMHVFIFSLYF